MDEAKIKEATIKYDFSKSKETSATFRIEYEDGSVKKGMGIQAVEEADKLVKELKEEPIYVKPVEGDNAQQVQE